MPSLAAVTCASFARGFNIPVVTVVRSQDDIEQHVSEVADELGRQPRAILHARMITTREDTLQGFRRLRARSVLLHTVVYYLQRARDTR